MQKTFASKAISFYLNFPTPDLPDGIGLINPYTSADVKSAVTQFYNKFFNDNNKRIFLWGINPGRFGGGLTGISFTDPVALHNECDIKNSLGNQKELSSKFIYKVIAEYGGVRKFFSKYFLTALFPLAIIKDEKNYNYYDDRQLFNELKQQMIFSIKEQISFGVESEYTICLGRKNFKYLSEINKELNFFERIEVLDHPRYIMQYKSKQIDYYISEYIRVLSGN